MIRVPAETELQAAVWLTWPGNSGTWPQCRDAVQRDHAYLISVCARFQPVELVCALPWQSACLSFLQDAGADLSRVTLHDWPANDAWTRDHGPVFLSTDAGLSVVDLPFTAWGGKFPPWDDDDQIAQEISDVRNLPCQRFPYVGEGGGVESNGHGVFLLTESVWLNPNRNPGVHREDIERAFQEILGADKIHWLRGGMSSDDTDGHIDTLARFVDPKRVAMPRPPADHPDAGQLQENYERISADFEVVDLPHPLVKGLPASYANFVCLNGSVLVPQFNEPEDALALNVLTTCFPDRIAVGIPCRTFLQEGGAVHCLTANEWA